MGKSGIVLQEKQFIKPELSQGTKNFLNSTKNK